VRPNVALAQQAGAALGARGAIQVDAQQRTSLAHVWAAGDCAEAYHRVLGAGAWIPLGTTSNKQGKIAGANAAGEAREFSGIVGTAGFKVFDLEVARTGLGPAELATTGRDAVLALSRHANRGHGYPGAGRITTIVAAERLTRRLLGAQMVGPAGTAIRIDTFATALHAGFTVDDVAELDLAYAPPFAPVYDPILIAATVAAKQVGSR
jgi:NADPH-dependent 2,4-dienoyl-CoA reductase/sulfur reductase-like enzyme